MPTKVVVGSLADNAELIKSLGSNPCVVCGKNSAKSCGALDDIEAIFGEVSVYNKIEPNPTIDSVKDGAAFAKENNADFIIGIGGGSPLDAAKMIAVLAEEDVSFDDISSAKRLPLLLIPTTIGTGSEVTKYSILTDEKSHSKINIASDLLFPDIAVLDSRYCRALPLSVARNTALDALSHAIEGMLSKNASPLSDMFAKEAIEIISSKFSSLIEGNITDSDYEKLLLSATLAGFVIAQTGTCAVHACGYALTSEKNIDHGRANALLLCDVLRRFPVEKTEKIFKIMRLSEIEFVLIMNTLIGEREQITKEEIIRFSQKTMLAKNITNGIWAPTENEVREIYANSLEVV
jgi:alcohol dehydrogenase class IV